MLQGVIEEQEARAILRKVQSIPNRKPLFNLRKFLFPKQLHYLDNEGSRNVLETSSRSGKTVLFAGIFLGEASTIPRRNWLYIAKKKVSAKRIIWKYFKRLNRDYMMGGHANETELHMTFPNDSTIYVDGADNESIIEKHRGIPYHRVFIDEGQAYPEYLEKLMNEVLIPRLIDWNGILTLGGTPNAARMGVFYRACQGQKGFKGYKKFHWTLHDNPWIEKLSGKSVEQIIQEECENRGVDREDPSIKREYYGIWVEDKRSLCYRYDSRRNHSDVVLGEPDTLPPEASWYFILGCDLGYEDSDALVVWAYSEEYPGLYLIDEYKKNKLTITALADKIKLFDEKYHPVKMKVDTGALGKKIAEEIRFRYGIHMEPAEKTQKLAYITLMNDDFQKGVIHAPSGCETVQEWQLLQWDLNHQIPREDTRFDNHLCDAALYAWREAKHYAYEPKIESADHPHDTGFIEKTFWENEAAQMQKRRRPPLVGTTY